MSSCCWLGLVEPPCVGVECAVDDVAEVAPEDADGCLAGFAGGSGAAPQEGDGGGAAAGPGERGAAGRGAGPPAAAAAEPPGIPHRPAPQTASQREPALPPPAEPATRASPLPQPASPAFG
jgi:hypothetical protein